MNNDSVITDPSITTASLIQAEKNIQKESSVLLSPIPIRQTKLRWLALFLTCNLMVGRYYCYDNPQALQSGIISQLGIDNLQYNLLYTVYALPNIILPFLGGWIVDNFGARRGILTFSGIVVTGQMVFFLGASIKSYAIMLIGRIIFGLGGEILGVARFKMLFKWFGTKEIGFAMAMSLAFCRLGSTLNTIFSPMLYSINNNLSLPTFFGGIFSLFSFINGIGICIIDYNAEKKEAMTMKKVSDTDQHEVKFKELFGFSKMTWLAFMQFSLGFPSVFGFLNISNSFLQSRFSYTNSQAGNMLSFVYIISGIFTPLAGKLIDIYGKRIYFMIISYLFSITAFITSIILPDCNLTCLIPPILPLILFTFFLIIFAVVPWSCLPLLVPSHIVGLASGIGASLVNLGEAICPIFVGWISDYTKGVQDGYLWSLVFLGMISVMGLLLSIAMNMLDDKVYDKVLNRASKVMKIEVNGEKEEEEG